jgi:hypothetical protein
MSEHENGPNDQDPAPLEHSDAERVSEEEAPPSSGSEVDEPADDDEKD